MSLPQQYKHVHFVGIGGYGMSALAFILLDQGYPVSGSDIKESPLTKALSEQGAVVYIGHDANNLGTADLVIYSTAIAAGNPELDEARRRGLPLWHRSELLAALLNSAYGIAVAGAHGKTTTTAMVALLLEQGGLDPTAIIGGVFSAFGSNARSGGSRYLVAEADESDSSFTRYFPQLAVVTGIEADHLEHYNNNYTLLQQAYRTFLSHLDREGIAVLCADDPALVQLSGELSCRLSWYSTEAGRAEGGEYSQTDSSDNNEQSAAHFRAVNLRLDTASSTFDLYRGSVQLASDITVGAPGRHNISNATAALAVAANLGLDVASCASVLANFHGVGRRFELIGEVNGITVIDDYAHHPTEVKATLEAAALSGRRVISLFQPHRYSRTKNLFEQFAAAFDQADRLYLHAVYPAGEKPLPGASAAALAGRIRELNPKLPVFQDDEISALETAIAADAKPGDLIITMGAGDVTYAAPRILALLKK